MHTGSDYLVNSQNPPSRTFTVTFQSKQANSTENDIEIAEDDIVEGTEAFRLRIVAVRFIGLAATIFRPQDGLTNTFADVIIEDNDCEFTTTQLYHFYANMQNYAYIHIIHVLSPPIVVKVSWIISEPIEVTEGEGVQLELFAQAFGVYATPIKIGVVCVAVIAIDLPPGEDTISNTDTLTHAINFTCLFAAFPARDFVVISGSILEFTDVGTLRSNSSNKLVLSIKDDNIAEPYEYFICTLQGGAVDRVRTIEPNRVIVKICDNEGEQKRVYTVHIV